MYVPSGYAIELLKDVLLVLFRDAYAVVGYLHDGDPIFRISLQRDQRVVRRVFDGVVDEVVDDVGDMQFVGKEGALDFACRDDAGLGRHHKRGCHQNHSI